MYEILKSNEGLYPNYVSWVCLLKKLLSYLGFYEVWLAQGVGNVIAFMSHFKQRLRDDNLQNWNKRIDNSPRSTFFKSIVPFNFQFIVIVISIII